MPTIFDEQALADLVRAYSSFDSFVFDVETWGAHRGDPNRNEVLWISLAGPGRADAIPMGHPNGRLVQEAYKAKEPWWDEENLTKTGKPRKKWKTVHHPAIFTEPPEQLLPGDVFDALKPLFFSERRKIGQNFKFDLKTVVKYFGELPPPPYGDTLIAAWLLDEKKSTDRSLGGLAKKHLDFTYDKSVGKEIEVYPFKVAARYSYLDAKNTWLIWNRLLSEIERQKLRGVLDLEMDVLGAVCDMELNGALLDIEAVQRVLKDVDDRCDRAMIRIYKATGKEINLNSPQQKVAYIFKEKKHRPTIWTCGCLVGREGCRDKNCGRNPSTKAEALKPLAEKDPVIKDMLEYSEWDKIRGTYLRPWLELNVNGRVFAGFNQHGTETGRFSSSEPNLQNVPRRGDKSELIRSLFIAPPRSVLVVADYSQIELRVLAHYTKDPTLTSAFTEDRDPHADTAALLFNKTLEDVEDWERDVAKTINFGIAYGAGPNKVAATAKISKRHAERILDQHRRAYPLIYSWKDYVVRQCRRRKPPSVTTILGRTRRLPLIMSSDNGLRAGAERQAVNSIIQGSAADIIKIAMVRLHQSLPEDMRLILTVHDELAIEAPEDRAEEGIRIMQEAMVGPGVGDMLRVPLQADAHAVKNWSDK